MLYDLTPPITPDLAVWPGDTPPSRKVLLEIARGDAVTLSTLRATVHLGAHADAPGHYGRSAPSIEQRSLDYYMGRCRVVQVDVPRATRITPRMFEAARRKAAGAGRGPRAPGSSRTRDSDGPAGALPTRVLIATGTFPDPRRWNSDFAALAPELVDFLHERGVKLVGIDTPSVDLADDKQLAAHQRFLAHDMAILEGLVLHHVPAGDYELIALPLPLVGFDASPVRAILRSP